MVSEGCAEKSRQQKGQKTFYDGNDVVTRLILLVLFHLPENGGVSHDNKTCKKYVRLKRGLSLHEGVALTIGLVVGAGLWITPGYLLKQSGSPGMALLMLFIAGVYALLGSMCSAELACTYPISGSTYTYLNTLTSPHVAFLYLWCFIFFFNPGSIAIKSLTVSHYLMMPFYDCEPPTSAVMLIAIVIIGILSYINTRDIGCAARAQTFFSSSNFAVLVAVGNIGAYFMARGETGYLKTAFHGTTSDPADIVQAMYSAIFTFVGWEAVTYMVEEFKNPYRNIPRAIFAAMMIIIPLYLLVCASFMAVIGENMKTEDVVGVRFTHLTLGRIGWIMPLLIAFNVAGGVNASILAGSRVQFIGGRNGHMPPCLSLISQGHPSPVVAIALQAVISSVLCYLLGVVDLINNTMFVQTLFDTITVAGLLYSRWQSPLLNRPFKVHVAFHATYFCCNLALLLIPLTKDFLNITIGIIVCLLTAVPYYVIFIIFKRTSYSLTRYNSKFTILLQKIFHAAMEEKLD